MLFFSISIIESNPRPYMSVNFDSMESSGNFSRIAILDFVMDSFGTNMRAYLRLVGFSFMISPVVRDLLYPPSALMGQIGLGEVYIEGIYIGLDLDSV